MHIDTHTRQMVQAHYYHRTIHYLSVTQSWTHKNYIKPDETSAFFPPAERRAHSLSDSIGRGQKLNAKRGAPFENNRKFKHRIYKSYSPVPAQRQNI